MRELLDEGRLGGVLIAELRHRGVPVTPNIKTSVETVIRTIRPEVPRPFGQDAVHLVPEATVTIMFTDVVGSTALTERLGDRGAREVLGKHDDIIRHQARACGGTEVKSTGDGLMLTFPSAGSGVICAVAAQRQLADHNGRHQMSPRRCGWG